MSVSEPNMTKSVRALLENNCFFFKVYGTFQVNRFGEVYS